LIVMMSKNSNILYDPSGFRARALGRYRLIISKKIFRSGGMAPSEWTRSVRAIRNTLVADYPAPGVNTTHRVVYCPPIAASLPLRVLSVSYFK
jgi:hypothetical protein